MSTFTAEQIKEDPILQYFEFNNLSENLQGISSPFCGLALEIISQIDKSAGRTTALEKLLESRNIVVIEYLQGVGKN